MSQESPHWGEEFSKLRQPEGLALWKLLQLPPKGLWALPYTAAQFAAGLLSRAVPMVASQPVQSLLSETTTPYTEIVPGIVGSLELEPEIVGSEMNKFGWWFTEFATCSSCSSGSQRFWATISHISHASLSHADLDPLSHAGWDGRHGPGWILISTVQLRWFFWILLYDLYDCCISFIQNLIYVITFGECSEHLLYGVLNHN
jgi:hypothetical protein